MKTWLITLPLLFAVNVAMAQGVEKEGAAAQPEAVAAPERAQTEAQTRAATQTSATSRTKRQGGDMRHCLNRKGNKEIIRCTEQKRRK